MKWAAKDIKPGLKISKTGAVNAVVVRVTDKWRGSENAYGLLEPDRWLIWTRTHTAEELANCFNAWGVVPRSDVDAESLLENGY